VDCVATARADNCGCVSVWRTLEGHDGSITECGAMFLLEPPPPATTHKGADLPPGGGAQGEEGADGLRRVGGVGVLRWGVGARRVGGWRGLPTLRGRVCREMSRRDPQGVSRRIPPPRWYQGGRSGEEERDTGGTCGERIDFLGFERLGRGFIGRHLLTPMGR